MLESYPPSARKRLLELRKLIMSTALELQIQGLEETVKWGQPAYVCKQGSTIRIDWKEKSPDKVSVLFNCQSSLIENFRELYKHDLAFSGNRAIELNLNQALPEDILTHCFSLALEYHKVKHLPLLGAGG